MMGVIQQADLYLAILLRKRSFYRLFFTLNFGGNEISSDVKKIEQKCCENLFVKNLIRVFLLYICIEVKTIFCIVLKRKHLSLHLYDSRHFDHVKVMISVLFMNEKSIFLASLKCRNTGVCDAIFLSEILKFAFQQNYFSLKSTT